jgi:uncharacterized protein
MLRYTEANDAINFTVRVVPRASRSEIVGEYDGALRVRVAASPVAGAANEELRRTLARAFAVPTRAVEIVSGHTAKTKQVRITGADGRKLLAVARLTSDL